MYFRMRYKSSSNLEPNVQVSCSPDHTNGRTFQNAVGSRNPEDGEKSKSITLIITVDF